ncbi:hypothetical protein [Amycolatopsis sp. FDAARGOS 1241]|uniref:hypothetical protein n=1 Tax=Amycolatopsis sp. FDAARGOS 1241 TaxID=2778070 RepID=UPI0019522E38|nr:hypothetical protein [Amycolatopsis sp. FDAARGOS 1241]QRP42797.1 hypothetical protein I6J71_25335 [Amycolatopsis sp. FDAARGOS 1241]
MTVAPAETEPCDRDTVRRATAEWFDQTAPSMPPGIASRMRWTSARLRVRPSSDGRPEALAFALSQAAAVAEVFADAYAEHRDAWEVDRTYWMPSIREAFAAWIVSGVIPV